MRKIDVSDAAYDMIAFAARIANLSISEAVDRLVGISDGAASKAPATDEAGRPATEEIPITVKYRGHRISGFLDPVTGRVRITESPAPNLIGTYRTPSQAAMETVRVLNPDRQHPQTNGWRFWYADDGQLIERHRRAI
ncbi:hypothetical protein [Dactylosporangium sp. CA-233914]|uniref:hypothetical protein n=1 Tax=Dactylosporangium sp. CA-233914 TaxID=3239934 RepID=UPI003D91CD93